MSETDTPVCILQERAYTDGWRDYDQSIITGGHHPYRSFYAKGWTDHERRDQRQAMYARREKP